MYLLILTLLIASYYLGYIHGRTERRMNNFLDSFKKNSKPEPADNASVTFGASKPPQEGYSSPQIVNPKSAREVKFEAEAEARREAGLSN